MCSGIKRHCVETCAIPPSWHAMQYWHTQELCSSHITQIASWPILKDVFHLPWLFQFICCGGCYYYDYFVVFFSLCFCLFLWFLIDASCCLFVHLFSISNEKNHVVHFYHWMYVQQSPTLRYVTQCNTTCYFVIQLFDNLAYKIKTF